MRNVYSIFNNHLKKMEAIWGQSFYKKNILEKLFRDVQASPFHPLPTWEQYAFTGERLLK
jgi:hypothetical protein